MEDLISRLKYVRSLLTAMSNLNREEAVDFFLHELETGIAETFRDVVKDYREFLYRRAVTEHLDGLGRKMEIMINNQKIIIDKQDEMIRQQMLGNFIAAANLMQTMNIANNTRDIANNTGNIARNTGNINAGLGKANDSLGIRKHTSASVLLTT